MKCDTCGQEMEPLDPKNELQLFCGEWYDCWNPDCNIKSVLVPSDALQSFLESKNLKLVEVLSA